MGLIFSGATEVEVDYQAYNTARDKDERSDEFFILAPSDSTSTAQLEERTVSKREEPKLFARSEKALTEADALVERDVQAWRIADFVLDDYAVLVG